MPIENANAMMQQARFHLAQFMVCLRASLDCGFRQALSSVHLYIEHLSASLGHSARTIKQDSRRFTICAVSVGGWSFGLTQTVIMLYMVV